MQIIDCEVIEPSIIDTPMETTIGLKNKNN